MHPAPARIQIGQVDQRLQLFTEKVGVGREARAEQALGGVAPDHRTQLLVDLDARPGPPAIDDGVGVVHHGLYVVCDPPVL